MSIRIPATQPKLCLHFGCIDRAGHHAHAPDGSMIEHSLKQWMGHLDGMLSADLIDRWLTHWFEAADGTHMTFIAKPDHSVDSRPGSWCGFLMPGKATLEIALEVAREAWPNLTVWGK